MPTVPLELEKKEDEPLSVPILLVLLLNLNCIEN
jgi:hypothetical protein